MLYFAYGSNLNVRAVADWCRQHGLRPPRGLVVSGGRPAVLDNYRLCFSIYSEYWGGGIGDIVYDPGKYVAGVVFEVSEPEMAALDEKVGRKLAEDGTEMGTYRRLEVSVAPLGKGKPQQAITYQGTSSDRREVAPTRQYMDAVIQGACQFGLSSMWVSYLQSFTTQAGRKPRPVVR